MRLYSYSNELLTFVEVKWANTKLIIGGILIGIVILLGVVSLNQSVGNALGLSSVNTLAAENNFLRYQVSQISPRVNKMEIQIEQLHERANKLHMLLDHRKIVGDTGSIFSNATKEGKLYVVGVKHRTMRLQRSWASMESWSEDSRNDTIFLQKKPNNKLMSKKIVE